MILFIQKILIENLNQIPFFKIGASNTEIRYTETQLAGKPIQFRTLQYNNFTLKKLFPLKNN